MAVVQITGYPNEIIGVRLATWNARGVSERPFYEALSIEQTDRPPRQRVLETRASLRHARAGAYSDRGEFDLARIQFNEAKMLFEEASSRRGVFPPRLSDSWISKSGRANSSVAVLFLRIGESLLPQLRAAGVVRTFFPLSMLCGLYAKVDLDRARSLAAETLVVVRQQRVALAPFIFDSSPFRGLRRKKSGCRPLHRVCRRLRSRRAPQLRAHRG